VNSLRFLHLTVIRLRTEPKFNYIGELGDDLYFIVGDWRAWADGHTNWQEVDNLPGDVIGLGPISMYVL